MKIKNIEKLVANVHDKIKYVIHKKSFKKALNNELVLEKGHKQIKFKNCDNLRKHKKY